MFSILIIIIFVKLLQTMKWYPLFARLLCALEGNYLEANSESMEHVDSLEGHGQCLQFSCSIPAVTGRGFIEVGYSTYCKVVHPTRKRLMFHIWCNSVY